MLFEVELGGHPGQSPRTSGREGPPRPERRGAPPGRCRTRRGRPFRGGEVRRVHAGPRGPQCEGAASQAKASRCIPERDGDGEGHGGEQVGDHARAGARIGVDRRAVAEAQRRARRRVRRPRPPRAPSARRGRRARRTSSRAARRRAAPACCRGGNRGEVGAGEAGQRDRQRDAELDPRRDHLLRDPAPPRTRESVRKSASRNDPRQRQRGLHRSLGHHRRDRVGKEPREASIIQPPISHDRARGCEPRHEADRRVVDLRRRLQDADGETRSSMDRNSGPPTSPGGAGLVEQPGGKTPVIRSSASEPARRCHPSASEENRDLQRQRDQRGRHHHHAQRHQEPETSTSMKRSGK